MLHTSSLWGASFQHHSIHNQRRALSNYSLIPTELNLKCWVFWSKRHFTASVFIPYFTMAKQHFLWPFLLLFFPWKFRRNRAFQGILYTQSLRAKVVVDQELLPRREGAPFVRQLSRDPILGDFLSIATTQHNHPIAHFLPSSPTALRAASP